MIDKNKQPILIPKNVILVVIKKNKHPKSLNCFIRQVQLSSLKSSLTSGFQMIGMSGTNKGRGRRQVTGAFK